MNVVDDETKKNMSSEFQISDDGPLGFSVDKDTSPF
jgi:hypothetical protein